MLTVDDDDRRAAVGALVSDRGVHRLAYVDPTVFDLEMASIFGRNWISTRRTIAAPNPRTISGAMAIHETFGVVNA